jgi:hypothetical protein
MIKRYPEGNGSNSTISFFVSKSKKEERYDGKIKASAATPTLQSKTHKTANGESISNIQIVRAKETSNASWSGRNWENFYFSLFGIRRDPEEK